MPEVHTVEQYAQELKSKLTDAYSLRVSDLQKSITLTEKLLAQFLEEGHNELAHTAKNHLGLFFLIQGKFALAEQYSQEALQYFELVNDSKGIADSKYNIGGIYYRTNKFHQSLQLLADSLKIYRELNDYYDQARTLKSMGTVYEYFSDFDKAIESYEKSIEASRKAGDLGLESNALNPLSAIYFKKGKHVLAMETIEYSIRLKKDTGDVRGLAFALYGRGKILIKVGKCAEAIPDLTEAIRILQEAGDRIGLSMSYNRLGMAYLELGQLAFARNHFDEALRLATEFHIEVMHFRVEYNLYLLAKREGDPGQALGHLEKYLVSKEAVINKESYNIIKTYEAVSRIEALEREANIQLEKSQIIETKNAELDSFFYRVSHDLKGPISTLQGLHNLVKLEVSDPLAIGYFAMYNAQVNRIHSIVISLIDLTQMRHLQNGKVKIDFPALVEDCIASCNYLENFKNIEFVREITETEYFSEWAIINTILQNLIENAVKYSRPQNPFVKVLIHRVGGGIQIEVSDNGLGIDAVHQSKIFDMFYRASERSKGSGLGLYILKRAVERLNGTIEVKSQINQGSVFKVVLPEGLPPSGS